MSQRSRTAAARFTAVLGAALVLPMTAPATSAVTPSTETEQEGGHVVVSELANGGPGGYHDNFIEIANIGAGPVDVTGWEVSRCTGSGSVASGPQNVLDGVLEPGQILLLAREHAQSTVDADLRYATSLANNSYGAIIRDADGATIDAVAVQDPSVTGAGCVEGTALPNTTDSVLAESWQRVQDTDDNPADFIRAPRTPGEPNATEPSPEPLRGDVLISEVAHAGPDGPSDNIVEIGNFGTEDADLTGWSVWRCNQLGRRFAGDLMAGPFDATQQLAPGEAVVVDEAVATGFVEGAGAGVLITDAAGAVVDRVAWADGQDSACADGRSLPKGTLQVDDGESYQRVTSTADNLTDFVAGPRTPGDIEAQPGQPEEPQEEFLSSTGGPNVRVAEMTNTGPAGNGDIFFEIVNYGDEPQDLTGWSVYRCIGTGVRASVPQLSEEQLAGTVLEPGQRLTAARSSQAGPEVAAVADVWFDISFATQYGLIIFDDEGRAVERVGSARHDVESYCADGTPLPGDLSGLHAETWQRVDLTGDAREDFIAAPRTPGRVNTQTPSPGPVDSPLRFTEVTNGGPGGPADNFMELTNLGTEPVELDGLHVYRCTGTGRVYEDTLQLSLPDRALAPGESFLMVREGGGSTIEGADATYGVSFNADAGFGVMLTDDERRVLDSVGVFSRVDSACTQGNPLPNDLDFPSAQSWQRAGDAGDNLADFVRAERTPGVHQPGAIEPIAWGGGIELGDIRISEVTGGGEGGIDDQFVEFGNYGDQPVDVSGYQVFYCGTDGRRMPDAQVTVPPGALLPPGEVLTLTGPSASVPGDARAVDLLPRDGYGVMVTDAEGNAVDRVGVYYDDVGLVTNAPVGPCTEGGVPLDRRMSKVSPEAAWEDGLSYHRVQATDNNYLDFVVADATPGELDAPGYHDPAVPRPGELDPVDVAGAERTALPELQDSAAGDDDPGSRELRLRQGEAAADVQLRGGAVAQIDWEASSAYSGVGLSAPPSQRVGEDETGLTELGEITDDDRGYPYQRFELEVADSAEQLEVVWTGTSLARHELQLYAWDADDEVWELEAAGSGEDGEQITLVAQVTAEQSVRDGVLDVLVQHGPRTADPFSDSEDEPNQAFKAPGEYDLAIAHVTDTQYIVEQNPESFTEIYAWLAANAEARDIAYVMHTGDLIQNWLRGDQEPDRAHLEFDFASRVVQILEDAGVANSVLPGNHDNVWGNSNDLFHDYFPVSRYADQPWFGEAGPEGLAAHYSVVEQDGIKLLLLSVPYDASETNLAWAEDVIAEHPDHNVVLGTHEYLRPEVDERANPQNGRWVSQGDVMFEQLVEPYDNVVLVMSGHLHGVRQRVTENAGGTVIETVADYQSYEHDAARDAMFLRLYQLDAGSGQVAINAYSPRLDSFEPHRYDPRDMGYTAESDELVMPIDLIYAKRVATSGLTVLESVRDIGEPLSLAAAEEAAVVWEDLADGVQYGWYARAAQPGTSGAGDPRYSPPATFTASVADDPTPDPTDPTPDPTDPTPDPTDPGTDPTDRGTDPTDPTDRGTDPTDPTDRGTDPTDPGSDPTGSRGNGTGPGDDGKYPGGMPGGTGAGHPTSPGGSADDLPSTGAPVSALVLGALALLATGALVLAHRRRAS